MATPFSSAMEKFTKAASEHQIDKEKICNIESWIDHRVNDGTWMQENKKGEPGEEYWSFVFTGIRLTKAEKKQIETMYKTVGWPRVVVGNGAEVLLPTDHCSVTLHRSSNVNFLA